MRRHGREVGEVLADWNPRAKEDGVGRAGDVLDVVDVERIDADEQRASLDEDRAGFRGEERVELEVAIGAPTLGPVGPHQHGLTSEVETGETIGADAAATFVAIAGIN